MKSIAALSAIILVAFGGIASSDTHQGAAVEIRAVESAEKTHWLTTSSGIRHNSGCRYFKNSKGRMCSEDEGRACLKCGG